MKYNITIVILLILSLPSPSYCSGKEFAHQVFKRDEAKYELAMKMYAEHELKYELEKKKAKSRRIIVRRATTKERIEIDTAIRRKDASRNHLRMYSSPPNKLNKLNKLNKPKK